jgi:hypothetical protein
MKRVAIVIAAGAVLAVSLLRPSVAVGQASSDAGAGAPALGSEPTAVRLVNRDGGTGHPSVSPAERALRGQGSGVRISQDADAPVRARQGSPEEALLGRPR